MEAEGKTINQEAWSPQHWKPKLPQSQSLSFAPHPHPLHSPHVLESVSSERRVGEVVRPLSGPGRELFSQLLVPCEGEQLSQASGMCSGR